MKIHLAWFTSMVLALFVAAAQAADPTTVFIKGTVSGQPESVSFWGQARISSRLAADPDFNRPRLVLTIDLTNVLGTGQQSEARYVVSGPEILQRNLAASHAVEIAFPFKRSASSDTVLARTGIASFALNFDTGTGAITSATGSVASPNFPQ